LNFTKPDFSLAAARMPPLFDQVQILCRLSIALNEVFVTFIPEPRILPASSKKKNCGEAAAHGCAADVLFHYSI
jgi:hypothetical protein